MKINKNIFNYIKINLTLFKQDEFPYQLSMFAGKTLSTYGVMVKLIWLLTTLRYRLLCKLMVIFILYLLKYIYVCIIRSNNDNNIYLHILCIHIFE